MIPRPGEGGGQGNLAGALFRSPPSTVTVTVTARGNEEERGQGRRTPSTKRAQQVQRGQETQAV